MRKSIIALAISAGLISVRAAADCYSDCAAKYRGCVTPYNEGAQYLTADEIRNTLSPLLIEDVATTSARVADRITGYDAISRYPSDWKMEKTGNIVRLTPTNPNLEPKSIITSIEKATAVCHISYEECLKKCKK